MNRIDKIRLAIDKGYACDPVSGLMIGPSGRFIGRKDRYGYNYISVYVKNIMSPYLE